MFIISTISKFDIVSYCSILLYYIVCYMSLYSMHNICYNINIPYCLVLNNIAQYKSYCGYDVYNIYNINIWYSVILLYIALYCNI